MNPSQSDANDEGRINPTEAEKHTAFEWLRLAALSGHRHAHILFQEVVDLNAARSASATMPLSEPDAHGLVCEAWTSPSESQVRFEVIKQFKRGHFPMVSRAPVDELYLYVSGIIQALERAQERSYGRDLPSGNNSPAQGTSE